MSAYNIAINVTSTLEPYSSWFAIVGGYAFTGSPSTITVTLATSTGASNAVVAATGNDNISVSWNGSYQYTGPHSVAKMVVDSGSVTITINGMNWTGNYLSYTDSFDVSPPPSYQDPSLIAWLYAFPYTARNDSSSSAISASVTSFTQDSSPIANQHGWPYHISGLLLSSTACGFNDAFSYGVSGAYNEVQGAMHGVTSFTCSTPTLEIDGAFSGDGVSGSLTLTGYGPSSHYPITPYNGYSWENPLGGLIITPYNVFAFAGSNPGFGPSSISNPASQTNGPGFGAGLVAGITGCYLGGGANPPNSLQWVLIRNIFFWGTENNNIDIPFFNGSNIHYCTFPFAICGRFTPPPLVPPPGQSMAQDDPTGKIYVVAVDSAAGNLTSTVHNGYVGLSASPARPTQAITDSALVAKKAIYPSICITPMSIVTVYQRSSDNKVVRADSTDELRTLGSEMVLFTETGGLPFVLQDPATNIIYTFASFASGSNEDLRVVRQDVTLALMQWANTTTEKVIATAIPAAGAPTVILNRSNGETSIELSHGDKAFRSVDGGQTWTVVF